MTLVELRELWRAHLLAGHAAKSRKAYEHFLALCKDADPDISDDSTIS
jgi:hypothetical protein